MKRISQEDFLIRVIRVIRGRLRLNLVWLRLRRAGAFVPFGGNQLPVLGRKFCRRLPFPSQLGRLEACATYS